MIASQIPNILTLLRIILIIPFLICLFTDEFVWAFYLFLVAGITDGVDGYLARRFNWTSHFGSFADPLADKLLMICSFLSLTYLGILPLWFTIMVVVRDVAIMTGVGGLLYLFSDVEFKPTGMSKINTALQIGLICLSLYEMAYHNLPDNLIYGLIGCIVFTTMMSLVNYVWVWSIYAYRGGSQDE